jgi:hypothetical protein
MLPVIFTLWASGFDPTGRFQLRPNKAGEPGAFIGPPEADY